MPELEYLTAKEAADLLRVHVVTVRRWVRAGELPSVRPGEKVIRIPRSVLEGPRQTPEVP